MIELLEAIKSVIIASTIPVRQDNVFFTENEDWVPMSSTYPAIGLKDGNTAFDWSTNLTYTTTSSINIIVWASVQKQHEALMGDHGILAISARIIALLTNNRLGITGMLTAFPSQIGESETFGDETMMTQRQIIVIDYEKEVILA